MSDILAGPACQSCGMPIMRANEFGCEAHGVLNTSYCRFCYWKGHFTEPDITFEQMVEKVASAAKEHGNVTDEQAMESAIKVLRKLKRWQGHTGHGQAGRS